MRNYADREGCYPPGPGSKFNSLPKSPTELEKDGPTFSSLFSLARACVWGDITPLSEILSTVFLLRACNSSLQNTVKPLL